MALTAGTRLGAFEILSSLGAGGMGEVYRATDTRLGREVAIKVLPAIFAADPERVTRFEREAKLLAALNHSNIAAIHGLEQSDGAHFLVLELVEGETLAERLARGPIPIAESLQIARQVAEALEAAHDKGVIHRDLKPANIKITPDGKVKVLDFGLAKALDDIGRVLSSGPAGAAGSRQQDPAHTPSMLPTITSPAMMTGIGMILGTAAYMSPEQAKGSLQIDKRSDIFSFGCVLYEMLTGRHAFPGETVTEVLAWVIAREPDFNRLPANLNPKTGDLIRRCLEKDVRKRWQAVGDLRVEIETILADPRGVELQPVPLRKPLAAWKVAALLLVGAIVGAAVAGGIVWNLRPTASPKLTRFPFVLPEDQVFSRTGRPLLAISPDGANVVYVANRQLYLRRMTEMESRPIAGTDQDVTSPFVSPDGQWIGFWSAQDSTLKKIAISGGAAITLCVATNPFGASWEGNSIVFGQGSDGILEISAAGGKPKVRVKLESNEVADSPQILPDGNAVLFTVTKTIGNARWDKADIVVHSRDTDARKILIQGGSAARYLPTGHIVYAQGANLLAVPFDLQQLEVIGGPVPIVEGIMRAGGPGGAAQNTGAANFGFSVDGTLAYVPNSSSATGSGQYVLALVDRNGKSEVLSIPPGSYGSPRVSPDGKQLIVLTGDEGSTIWVYNLTGSSSLRRLTFEGSNASPVWSPDSRRVAFRSDVNGTWGISVQNSDGSGFPERLISTPPGQMPLPEAWSPDGKTLIFSMTNSGADFGISTISLAGERKVEPFVDLPGTTQYRAAFSPDGRWVAYTSTESGRSQVYVQPFPKTGAKYQISREGGNAPVWSSDGKELLYYQVDPRKLAAVRIQTQPSFSFGNPVSLPIDGMIQSAELSRQYDVTPDGKRFLVLLPQAQGGNQPRTTQQINIVLNWVEELKRRVPGR